MSFAVHKGYVSGCIGKVVELHARYYHRLVGFDLPFDDLGRIIDYIRDMDMPAELQEKWGYPQLTQQDKANILGLNLARLTGIEPKKRAPLR